MLQAKPVGQTQRLRGARGVARRAAFLRMHPLCAACAAQDVARAATDVDHVRPLHMGGPDDWGNLQSLCGPCHADKTARERGAVRRAAFGPDGNPLRPAPHWER